MSITDFAVLRVTVIAFALSFIVPVSSLAQSSGPSDEESQSSSSQQALGIWHSTIKGRVAGNQSGYHNWQEGGSSTVSFTGEIRGTSERQTEKWKQEQRFRFAFGQKKQSGLSFRKDQDIILYDFSLQYQGEGNFDPTVGGEFRTQFAPSYNYNSNPFNDDRNPPVKVSDAFSPAYIKQSLGLTYDADDWWGITLGVAGKETVVTIDQLRPLYMESLNQSVRVQVGMDLTTDVEKEIFENVMLQSRLGLFAAFNKSDLPDMRWDNRITMKVNQWIEVDLEAVAYYDRDVSSDLQFRESLSLGVYYTFL